MHAPTRHDLGGARRCAAMSVHQRVVVIAASAASAFAPVHALAGDCVLSTSAMRPLNRSAMPLVLGVLGLVSRCSMPSSWHS
ncbi:hypothetical protein IXO1088_017380 [Xanthomonas oryzae pv. oryzae]|nr:hypothetical protein EBA26_24860 [Xanthomonas oryzae pv. oryzae]QDQ68818.1 hypothetical protein EBA19_25170 [Xanthomonas oryzae pv. oryzae]QIE16694.1 hypothetical protein IXO1088_017380 [Xanthomonas oryzae pv. oryzae]QIE20580.1 hypothetical protein IXO704_017130 [Xanthomonas oryzae pv. oryzae]UXV79663.1 hypothetical protein IXO842_016090 [Xanthomonas oryzae pv. oryzae]